MCERTSRDRGLCADSWYGWGLTCVHYSISFPINNNKYSDQQLSIMDIRYITDICVE